MGRPARKDSTDWPLIFDLIASEYGYTWNQFGELTYKLLHATLEAIQQRTHNNLVIQAALRGVKLNPYKKLKSISEIDLKAGDQQVSEILKRKQEKFKKKSRG